MFKKFKSQGGANWKFRQNNRGPRLRSTCAGNVFRKEWCKIQLVIYKLLNYSLSDEKMYFVKEV